MMDKKTKSTSSGFTMMETIAVVAIIVILMGVGFVAVINYRRSMLQLELDATAKEIYLAAQNHLTSIEGEGIIDSYKDESLGIEDPAKSGVYYFLVGNGTSHVPTSDYVLGVMLPFGSIDETVRLGGSYIIRYQKEARKIIDVYYASPTGLGGLFGGFGAHTFSAGEDYANVLATDSKARYDYNGAVIGYYGGEDLSDTTLKVTAPIVKVENGDVLKVNITNDDSNLSINDSSKGTELQLRLIIEGDAGAAWLDLKSAGKYDDFVTEAKVVKHGVSFTVVIDDVTKDNGEGTFVNFIKLLPPKQKTGSFKEETFNPGENLKIYAYASVTGSLGNVAYSSTSTVNSLFGNGSTVTTETAGVKNFKANITSFRHLINLDGAVSGFNQDPVTDAAIYSSVKAKQKTDLLWVDKTKEETEKAFVNNPDTSYSCKLEGTGDEQSASFTTLKPVKPSYPLTEYDGSGLAIANVKVDAKPSSGVADAGIFESLTSGSTIKNLEIVDCAVKTSNGNAGALVGSTNGELTLENVLVHDTSSKIKSKVEGTAAVGGLVGKLIGGTDSVTVDGCGAAVLVSATGTGTDNAAGGLIGATSGTVAVKNSYAGGRTKDKTAMYDSDRDPDSYNVVATSGTAGGLIGQYAGTEGNAACKIENCYATTSVSRGSGSTGNIGGLVGQASNATITNCYATGLIGAGPAADSTDTPTASTDRGAFAGSLSEVTLTVGNDANNTPTNKYYEIVNDAEILKGTLRPVGTDAKAKVEALDKDLATYNAFYDADARVKTKEGGSGGSKTEPTNVDKAYPYDSELEKRYASTEKPNEAYYPLKTIYMLNPSATGPWTKSHYGDWPSPETLVVNAKQ